MDHVFDADAELACQVDARFGRDDAAFDECIFTVWANVWGFVNFEADAVTEGVAEVFAVTGFCDDVACDLVAVTSSVADLHMFDSGFLSL